MNEPIPAKTSGETCSQFDRRQAEAWGRLESSNADLFEALVNLKALYEADEGNRKLPEYRKAVDAIKRRKGLERG